MFYSYALKKANVNSTASIMDKKQQRTFERHTTWQDARTQSRNAEFIGCLNTTIQTDRVHMSPHCCTMLAQGDQTKENQLRLPKEQEINSVYQPLVGLQEASPNCIQSVIFLNKP